MASPSIPAPTLSLNKTLHLLEELIDHHLRYPADHPLPYPGNQSSNLGIGTVIQHGPSIFLFKINAHVALHEAGTS